ncbi:MAG: ABC transporter ATP-binding protein [Pseudomonadota bacterium]
MTGYRTLLPYFYRYRGRLAVGLGSLLLVDLLQLLIPRVIKTAVDDLTYQTADAGSLALAGGTIVAIALVIGVFRFVWRMLILGFSRVVEEDLRNRLFAKLLTLPTPWFMTHSTGDIMARATNDMEAVRMAAGMGLVALVDSLLMGAASIGFMIWIDFRLTLLALIPMPLITILTRYMGVLMHRRHRDVQETFGRMTEKVREYLSGIRVVQAHVKEELALRDLDDIGRKYVRDNIRLNKVAGAFIPLMLMFANLSLAGVIYFGGRMTVFAEISPGDLVAFISYLGLLTWPMMALGWVANLVQRGSAALDRLNMVLDEIPAIADPPRPATPVEARGEVEIRGLTFSYPGRKEEILGRIDLIFPAGQTTALVGRTGSGKTTILNLLMRLFDPPPGSVLLDGIPIEEYRLRDLRAVIGYAPQDGYIFSGTVAENISFGLPEASGEAIMAAARLADFEKDIVNFPKGLETEIGERGITLSGGQKQRLALARALMSDPALLLLDDTFSAVDTATEEKILANLAANRRGKTTIVAANRLSSLRDAALIHVIDGGRIVQSGRREDLEREEGYYSKTLRLQQVQAERNEGQG